MSCDVVLDVWDWSGVGDLAMSFQDWWIEQAAVEARQTVSKMEEYGSGDLVEIGRQMWQMAGRDVGLLPRVHAMEIGCMFYLLGKIARVTSAVERGDMASDDTWFDIGVYAKMVLAAREGAWQL